MSTLHFSPQVLEWAASQIGRSLDSLAHEIVTSERKVNLFLNGDLTLTQAEKVAKTTRVPFGYLFLDVPPKIETPKIPDLRQTVHPEPLSNDFYELLEDIQRKQEWFKEYLLDMEIHTNHFVGKFSVQTDYKVIASDIRNALNLTMGDSAQARTQDEYYSLLSKKIEQLGILVFKSGLVSSNQTKKGLSVKEFRGFAIADKVAPVIFINGKDAPAAWIFTLAHEVAHIWLGQSGVSDGILSQHKDYQIEVICNRVAGELLVPEKNFLEYWNPNEQSSIDALSSKFKVSRLVIARRAFDLEKISWEKYKEIHLQTMNSIKKNAGSSTPIPKTTTLPIQNSKRFTKALVTSAMGGHTMLRDAARLLNTSPNQIIALANKS